jgi:hypothetical protein
MSEPVTILDSVDADLVPDSPRLAGIVTVSELRQGRPSRGPITARASASVILPRR